ncbi:MAG: histidine kinase [Nocardioides sp.]
MVRNPVVQFLAAGVLTAVLIAVGTWILSGNAASEEATNDARATTEILAHSVAEPAIPRGLAAGEAGAVDRFDRRVGDRLLVQDVLRIKIWSADGTIVYSDRPELIGTSYDLGDEELEILRAGGSEAEVSDLGRPENRFERSRSGVVEVYTSIASPEGEPLLFEAYFAAADLDTRKEQVFRPFYRITLGGLAILLAVATPMLWVLTRRLTRAADERERLLRSAADASDSERRRIARDLHDGVVQDLAGTAFAVSALARSEPDPVHREALDRTGAALRGSLRSLRSLLVEIHPPELRAEGLAAALGDLIAPAEAAGMTADVSVEGMSGVPEEQVALVWRVAQEAVRNTIRHSGAGHLGVLVRGAPDRVVLEVTDDGDGFRPDAPADPTSFGLRGLQSLVADSGGRLEVRSLPGQGTTVRLEVQR